MEVDETLSSSSKDVIGIYNGLAVIDKPSVAATRQVLTVRIANMQRIQYTVNMFKSWHLVLSVVWVDSYNSHVHNLVQSSCRQYLHAYGYNDCRQVACT